jgi:hypothetical protein
MGTCTWVGMDEDEDYRELYLCVEDVYAGEVDFLEFVADDDDMLADDWFLACDMDADEDEDDYEEKAGPMPEWHP